ncbi:MAG: DUF2059 domain-containing protein [Sphingomonas sp.]
MVILLVLAAAAAQPSVEALKLGRELAGHGTLAALLPMMKAKEVDDLLAAHKELNAADQERLRKIAGEVFDQGRERIFAAEGQAYAKALSVDDLRAILAFYRTPAADRFQAALPQVIGGTVAAMGKMDFKADGTAAYCKQTGKLCGK